MIVVRYKTKSQMESDWGMPLPNCFNNGCFLRVNNHGGVWGKNPTIYTLKEVVSGTNFKLFEEKPQELVDNPF